MRRLLLLAVILLAPTTMARAGIIFDNLEASGGVSAIAGATSPGGTFGFGTELTFAEDTRISQFAVFNALQDDSDFRFVIFANERGSAPLYSSPLIRFSADAGVEIGDATWKLSPLLDFTFLAGRTYEIGSINNGVSSTPYLSGSTTIGPITAPESNPAFLDYFNPSYLGNGGVQVPIRLYGAVPEPTSLALVGIGIVMAGLAARPNRAG